MQIPICTSKQIFASVSEAKFKLAIRVGTENCSPLTGFNLKLWFSSHAHLTTRPKIRSYPTVGCLNSRLSNMKFLFFYNLYLSDMSACSHTLAIYENIGKFIWVNYCKLFTDRYMDGEER